MDYSNLHVIEGQINPIQDNVLVSDMYFGEQTTEGGLIISDDDGKTRGIYPRWGKVYKKGPNNKDPFEVGQWILVEHGRWSRGFRINDGNGEKTLRLIDRKSVLLYSDKKPTGAQLGKEFSDGPVSISPDTFNTLEDEGTW